MKKDKVVKKL